MLSLLPPHLVASALLPFFPQKEAGRLAYLCKAWGTPAAFAYVYEYWSMMEYGPLHPRHYQWVKCVDHTVWPEDVCVLTFSNLERQVHMNLKDNAFNLLKENQWRKLKMIDLDIFTDGWTMEYIRVIATQQWPLLEEFFLLNCENEANYLTCEQFNLLVRESNFPLLQKIFISIEGGWGQGMELFNWPLLTVLDMVLCELGPNEARVIVRANMPLLEEMDLMANNLGDIGAGIIAQGRWPLLENDFTNVGIQYIKDSDWPSLKYLRI